MKNVARCIIIDADLHPFVGGTMEPIKVPDNDSAKENVSSKKPFDEESSTKKKIDDNFRFGRTPKKDVKYDDLLSFVKGNTKDTIAYVLVIAGILMMFFDSVSMYGGLIVGVVLGLYFAKELSYIISNASRLIEEEGLAKSLLFGALLLVIFIKAPFLFIGAGIVALIRTYFITSETKP